MAALQLHHNVGLKTSNLQVLGQFVTSLNRMSSEVIKLGLENKYFHQTRCKSFRVLPRSEQIGHYPSGGYK